MALFTRRKAIGLFPFVTLASPSSLFLFNPSSANAEPQAATKPSGVRLLSQDGRPPASVPLQGADRKTIKVAECELGAGQRGTYRVDLGGATQLSRRSPTIF